jgi:flagellar export protein FliJ
MNSRRGDVVVRVRIIAEDIATADTAVAQSIANNAASAARSARSRAGTHPLAGSQARQSAAAVMTAVGVASALREAALSAQRRSDLAEQSLDEARRRSLAAAAQRKAAERLVERRIAAVLHEQRRASQRVLDENAAVPRSGARRQQ